MSARKGWSYLKSCESAGSNNDVVDIAPHLIQEVSSKHVDNVLWMAMQQHVYDETLSAWDYQHCQKVMQGLYT